MVPTKCELRSNHAAKAEDGDGRSIDSGQNNISYDDEQRRAMHSTGLEPNNIDRAPGGSPSPNLSDH
jgi:hypothetical protein